MAYYNYNDQWNHPIVNSPDLDMTKYIVSVLQISNDNNKLISLL